VSGQSEGFEQGTSSHLDEAPKRFLVQEEEEEEEALPAETDAIRTLREDEDIGSAMALENAFETRQSSLENMDVIAYWSRRASDTGGDY
jgi:hypothetical protein